MKSNNFPLKAIALAVSLAMVPSVHAQTADVTVDTSLVGVLAVANGNPGQIDNAQIQSSTETAESTGAIVLGTSAINGAGAVSVTATSNDISFVAAGNSDGSGTSSTINLIEVPVLSTDGTLTITSGQASQAAVSALLSDTTQIGSELSGTLTSTVDADVSSNDIQLSSQANAVDNRITGDVSAQNNAQNGTAATGLATATATGTSAVATVGVDSDIGIANAQTANSAVRSGFDSTALIGVEFGDLAATAVAGAVSVTANSSSVSGDSGVNSAINVIDVDGGSAISRNIANAQLGTDGAVSTVAIAGTEIGLTTATNTVDFAAAVSVTANASSLLADADGNEAINQIIVELDAAGSNQSVASTQSQFGNVSASNTGTEIGATIQSATTAATTVDLSVSSSDIQTLATSNVVDNDIVLVDSGSTSNNDLTNTQSVGDAANSANVSATNTATRIGLSTAADFTATDTLTAEILSNTVNATAIGSSANNRIAIGQIATNSTNQLTNNQSILVNSGGVAASASDVSVGVSTTNAFTLNGATGLDLDIASTAITTSASGNDATNQVLFTGIAGNSAANINDVTNAQSIDATVTSSTTDAAIGFESTGALSVTGNFSVDTLNNIVSSDASANFAGNSIDALSSVENAVNTVDNDQTGDTAGVAVVSTTNVVSIGASTTGTDTLGGVLNVDATSNDVTSRARFNTSVNTVSVAAAGSANSSNNTVNNTQSNITGSAVTSISTGVNVGLSATAAGTVAGLVTSNTNSNTVSSAATVNTSVNTVDLNGLANSTTNTVNNDQDIVDTIVTSTTGTINIGVSTAATTPANTFLITANSNVVSSAANGNVSVNGIENTTSADTSVNGITSNQLNTGSTVVSTAAVNIGADVSDLGAAGIFSVSANSNDVTSSASLNAVSNVIGLDNLANASSNTIDNDQTATLGAPTGATVTGVLIGASTDQAAVAIAATGTAQANTVSADTVGNSAFNSISADDFGTSLVSSIANDQTLDGAQAFASTVSGVSVGLFFDATTFSGDLIGQVSSNEVSAAATGNTAVNQISTTLFGGVGSTIANTQLSSNTSIAATLNGVSIGITGGAIGGTGAVTVNATGNSINATAVGNAAVNRITGLGN